MFSCQHCGSRVEVSSEDTSVDVLASSFVLLPPRVPPSATSAAAGSAGAGVAMTSSADPWLAVTRATGVGDLCASHGEIDHALCSTCADALIQALEAKCQETRMLLCPCVGAV
jgi:hypothetical protein